MTDGVEYLLVNINLNAVEHLLSVDGRIVSIETGGVVVLLLTAPFVVPDHRQILVANVDDGIDKRMNGELENGRAVTSFRRTVVMVVRTGAGVSLTVELHGVTFENVLLNNIIIRFVDSQYQCHNAVASVTRSQRVTIDTSLGIGVTLELVACTLAHRVTDGVEYLIDNVNLKTIIVLLTIDGSVVAIPACAIILLFVTAPFVLPNIG